MRSSVLIVMCLMSLVFAGPVSAACATDLDGWADSVTIAPSGSAAPDDCGMGQNDQSQNKAHRCNHDACCGVQLVVVPGIGNAEMPAPPITPVVASVTKQLTGFGGEPLLHPPRA